MGIHLLFMNYFTHDVSQKEMNQLAGRPHQVTSEAPQALIRLIICFCACIRWAAMVTVCGLSLEHVQVQRQDKNRERQQGMEKQQEIKARRSLLLLLWRWRSYMCDICVLLVVECLQAMGGRSVLVTLPHLHCKMSLPCRCDGCHGVMSSKSRLLRRTVHHPMCPSHWYATAKVSRKNRIM